MRVLSRWRETLAFGLSVGLATGFYLWALGRPAPATTEVLDRTQAGLLAGLPLRLLLAAAGATALAGVGSILAPPATVRSWRGRLALASAGFYLAAASSILGSAALVLAPAAVLAWLIALRADAGPPAGAALVVFHVGALVTALGSYEQSGVYAMGARPFLDNLAALKTLWLGG
jgi:hypothetical protein